MRFRGKHSAADADAAAAAAGDDVVDDVIYDVIDDDDDYRDYDLAFPRRPGDHHHATGKHRSTARPARNISNYSVVVLNNFCLQCFDAVGWVAGRASGL